MIDQNYINFYFGQVLESDITYTSDTDVNMLFTINVEIQQQNNFKILRDVKPAFSNIKQIPVTGETVLLFQGYDHTSSYLTRKLQWYYFPTIGIQSNVNSNILPVNSKIFKPDPNFIQRATPILQPYLGDILIEGRYGNSIRFSSTINTGKYNPSPSWSGDKTTDPIIILSNSSKTSKDKKFVVENIQTDDSSLYLTSTQNIDKLNLSNNLTYYTNFLGSQFIGVGDRIILRAKKDVAVIDSEEGIVLNTKGEIRIGADDADEPLPHGTILYKILDLLTSAIQAGCTDTNGGIAKTNATLLISQIYNLLPELNSTKYKIKNN
jgi:hypothetical protein